MKHSVQMIILIRRGQVSETFCSDDCGTKLGRKYCEKRKVFSLVLKDDRVTEQCLKSCGSDFQMWGPKQEKMRKR